MKMKAIIILALALLASVLDAEQFRLKFPATVDIIEDGNVVGTRKLKAGTVLESVNSEQSPTDQQKEPAKKEGSKLRVSSLSPIMFKNTKPAAGAVLRADVCLSSSYYGPFDGKEAQYWSVDVRAKNDDWEGGEFFYGYIRKTSPVAKDLVRKLSDGKDYRALVKIVPVKSPDYDDLVSIEAVEFLKEQTSVP